MQTIARRAPGKDPRRIQSHSSQSTNKTAKKGNNLKATKTLTTSLTRKQVGGSTNSRGETCRQLRHRHQIGTEPIGRRALGILSILQCLTTGKFFSGLGQVPVAWRNTSSQPTGRREQYTHKYSTCRVAQHDHISSREQAWFSQ